MENQIEDKLVSIALLKAKPGSEEAMKQKLTAMADATRRLITGCIKYDLHQSIEDNCSFLLYGNWENLEAYKEFVAAPHAQAWLKEAPEYVAEPIIAKQWKKIY